MRRMSPPPRAPLAPPQPNRSGAGPATMLRRRRRNCGGWSSFDGDDDRLRKGEGTHNVACCPGCLLFSHPFKHLCDSSLLIYEALCTSHFLIMSEVCATFPIGNKYKLSCFALRNYGANRKAVTLAAVPTHLSRPITRALQLQRNRLTEGK